MGGCIGVQLGCSCDEALRQVSNHLCGDKNYVLSLPKHVKALKSDLSQLKALCEDTLTDIRVLEESKGLKRRAEVRLWLNEVGTIVEEAEDKLRDEEVEIKKLCIGGYCSKSYSSSFSYGRKVWSLLRQVRDLHSRREKITVLADKYVITKVKEIAIDLTISRSKIESTWNILMEDRVGCLGLYGVPGVGKTTLLSQINNEFVYRDNDFDVVIWVEVPKNHKISRIQEEIGRRLELYNEEWIQKSENEKACEIKRELTEKRYVLLLDNMLVKVDLQRLGVPLPDKGNRSKIAFTTRGREVCSEMEVHEAKEVTQLYRDEAWVLFRRQVGDDILRGDPGIFGHARFICNKCCGLPVVINAIAQTMAHKNTLREWQDAAKSLSSIITELASEMDSSLAEFSSQEDIIVAILKFSYNNLENQKVKRCLRYYALFPENFEMRKDELLEYWDCEGITKHNQGLRVFDKLVDACLLMYHGERVKMHDMVRKMALLEDSSIGEMEGSIVVKTDTKLIDIPNDLNWKVLKKMSLINNQIMELSGSPSCPNLTTLLLCHQKLENISMDFFLHMSSLRVLDLSYNQRLSHLPDNISKLVSLRYLDLSFTGIEFLPVSLKELKQLICLNLEHTNMLHNIVGISALQNLKVLRLLGSRFRANVNFVEELRRLEHISVLTISLCDEATLRCFFSSQELTSHTQAFNIRDVATEADGISIVAISRSVQYLNISDTNINMLSQQITPTTPVFERLYEVKLYDCRGPKHLTWLLYAPHLANLHVERVKDIEEILSKDTAEDVMEARPYLTPFEKLRTFVFKSLDELTSIYWSTLPFESLNKIFIRQCPKLKKLPLNSESAKECKVVIDAESDWLENLEWDDEDACERFCPS